jgi:hypothetical protein
MAAPFSSALYYPFIDVKNERWLRSAVLCWDSIRTIVPEGYSHPYSSEFAQELSDEGVLVPVRVSSSMEEVEALTEKVMEYLTSEAATGVVLGTDKRRARVLHPQKISPTLRDLAHIHPEKLSYEMRSTLRHGLGPDGWLHVDPGFANFYMTLLATQLAQRLRLGLITESASADQLAIATRKARPLRMSSERRIGRHFEAFGPRRSLPADMHQGMLVELMVQGIELPENLSVRKILAFKRDHQEELSVFRREVARLATDIPSELPLEAVRQSVLDQYQAHALPAINSLRRSLRAQRWEAGLNGLLKASFFSAAPASVAMLAGVPGSVALAAGAGLSLMVTGVVLNGQIRRTKTESPYSYLLSLERGI